jgi:hypothetical protein
MELRQNAGELLIDEEELLDVLEKMSDETQRFY